MSREVEVPPQSGARGDVGGVWILSGGVSESAGRRREGRSHLTGESPCWAPCCPVSRYVSRRNFKNTQTSCFFKQPLKQESVHLAGENVCIYIRSWATINKNLIVARTKIEVGKE